MITRIYWLTLLLLSSSLLSVARAEFKIPRLAGPVMDQVGFLPKTTARKLNQALLNLKRSGGSQIQILTVASLEGLTIEQASIQVTDKWKLGGSSEDNGVLLLVTKKEQKIRIEVGQGLEGRLTDAHSKRIIAEVMIPLFRSGNADSGILMGVVNIVKKTDPKANFESYLGGKTFDSSRRVKKKKSLFSRLVSILIMIAMIIMFIRNPMLFMLLLASSGRSRGGFGGGGGGGGWSGGGGGFSGGGASGGW